MCAVLAHFYCRKPNWSARVYYYPRVPSSRSFFLLFRSLFRESTHRRRPGLARTLLPCYVATPYRVLNTNRDVSFRQFPEDFQDAIITINEEVNGASGSSRCPSYHFVRAPRPSQTRRGSNPRAFFLSASLTALSSFSPRIIHRARRGPRRNFRDRS